MKTVILKRGKNAQIYKNGHVHCVDYHVMTASGPALKTKLCQNMDEAEEFFSERENNSMPTNGYELHRVADL